MSAVVFATTLYFLCTRFRHRYEKRSTTISKETQFHDLPLFEFAKLATATNNFSADNKLGEGGFGPVYKGIWDDGQQIAVKRLSRASGQGLQEFMNEVELISKLQHKNLVRLFGCCVEGEEKLLVYELLPNKSLDAILFGSAQTTRYRVVNEVIAVVVSSPTCLCSYGTFIYFAVQLKWLPSLVVATHRCDAFFCFVCSKPIIPTASH